MAPARGKGVVALALLLCACCRLLPRGAFLLAGGGSGPALRRPAARTCRAQTAAGGDVAEWVAGAGMGEVVKTQMLGSSSWSSFSKVTTSSGEELFVKTSSRAAEDMFRPEAKGLMALYDATHEEGLMKIPKVHYVGNSRGGSLIIMEYLKMGGGSDARALGRAMAAMHLHEAPTNGRFGFDVDNTIGDTPQKNDWCDDWVEFYKDRRLRYQVARAGDGYVAQLFKSIAPRLGRMFEGLTIKPSVLHGDLWSGNIGSADGKPTIFDPAVYYGHHEAEWGMSWCASLGPSFWQGYRELIPEDPGFHKRRALYEAYHQLNHYNLFGGGYLYSAKSCLEQVKQSLDEME